MSRIDDQRGQDAIYPGLKGSFQRPSLLGVELVVIIEADGRLLLERGLENSLPGGGHCGVQLTEGRDGEGFRLHVVNAIWGQRGYNFEDAFLDTLALNYGAGLRLVDFQQAAEEARVTINDWVSEQTEGRIEDLIPAGAIDALTRLRSIPGLATVRLTKADIVRHPLVQAIVDAYERPSRKKKRR